MDIQFKKTIGDKKPLCKKIIQYTSPLDALAAVQKRLSLYEHRHQMKSDKFFDQYNKGLLSDDALLIEWVNDYRHYLALHQEIQQRR